MKRLVLALAVGSALTSFAQDGSLVAKGKPGNAGVFVDGKYLGPASRFSVAEKYSVPSGEVEVTIRDPRYEDYTTKVTINPNKKTVLRFKMNPVTIPQGPFGLLRLGGDGPESFMSVAAGDTGAVWLNDKFYGYIDELNNAGSGLLIPPGTYKLKITDSAFNMERDITIEANKKTFIPLIKE